MCRNNSYRSENLDILDRCSWYSDPLLLWEFYCGQIIKPGALRPKKAKKSPNMEVLQVPLAVPEEDLQEEEEEQLEE